MYWIAHNHNVHKRKKPISVFILYIHNNQLFQTQLKQLTRTEIYFDAETVFIQSCRSQGLSARKLLIGLRSEAKYNLILSLKVCL